MLLGTSVKRLDAPDKVTGRAKYTYDINRPGMIYGKIVRSPLPHARIVSIDSTEAQKAPGVKAAISVEGSRAPRCMFQGDAVAAIAADTEERAYDAARLVRVRYEALPHFANVEQAMAPNAPVVFMGGNTRPGTGRGDRRSRRRLQAGRAHRRADVLRPTSSRTSASRRTARVCEWDGDKLTAWVSTQGVHGSRAATTRRRSEIPQANVRVITQYMGGGFGSKFTPTPKASSARGSRKAAEGRRSS